MKFYRMVRDTDVTGVSGPGHVADVIVFGDGTTVTHWRGEFNSTAVWSTFEQCEKIHGHDGATRFEPVVEIGN